MKNHKGPKVLLLDIETSPLLAYVWAMWDQNVALNQINGDWSILSWSAKWLNSDKVMYMDQRHSKNLKNEKTILKGMWKLLDEAEVIITHNGRKFDRKKLNAKFIKHKFQPPSSYKHIDTLEIAKSQFAFKSNKLENLADELLPETDRKSKHKKFPGFELWSECLKGNQEAWQEMEDYNKQDVIVLEKVYKELVKWDDRINFNVYHNDLNNMCKCGSEDFKRNGYYYTQVGKFQRWKCTSCGSESRDRTNLFTKDKKAALRINTVK